MEINATKTVRELALEIPGATRVFEKMGIDYCCGGAKPFQEACLSAGLSTDEVIRSLEEARQATSQNAESADWQSKPLSALTAYIVSTHHVFTKAELARLDALLSKVCSVHGQNHPELSGIQSLFKELTRDLIPHMQKEEMILFPYIEQMEKDKRAHKPSTAPHFGTVQNPIRMMSMEHDMAGNILKEIRELSDGFSVPADGCISYKTLYSALETFEQDLHQHIHLENNILFPRAATMEQTN
jgi:regulator of cell morphogenesis and NO signaling